MGCRAHLGVLEVRRENTLDLTMLEYAQDQPDDIAIICPPGTCSRAAGTMRRRERLDRLGNLSTFVPIPRLFLDFGFAVGLRVETAFGWGSALGGQTGKYEKGADMVSVEGA